METRLIALGFLSLLALPLFAQTQSPIQSGARPYNLDIHSPVYEGGSDAPSADFLANTLPSFLNIVNNDLKDLKKQKNMASVALDPSSLLLGNDATVRAYFVSDGSNSQNSLGFGTNGSGLSSSDAALIFPASSSATRSTSRKTNRRTDRAPLTPGDFVDLGAFKTGTQLDFFLIAKGARSSRKEQDVWSTDSAGNMDGLVHAVSLAPDGSPYLLIGFEDKSKGNNDYNDLVIAVEIRNSEVQGLAGPEPSLAMGSMLALSMLLTIRRGPARCS